MTGEKHVVKLDANQDLDRSLFDKIYLFLTLFVVGGVIMMVELIGTRILAPFFGNTIYTWSSLITVTLIALAIGYFVGGIIADKKPDLRILYMIIYLACIWMVFIPLMQYRVLLMSSDYGIRFGTLLSAFVLFASPLTLLGTAVPFAIKIETEMLKTLGTTAGSLYAVSTLGSFIGTILTGFYLIPNMGVGRIIFLAALSLLVISSGWFITRKDWKFVLTLFAVFLFFSYLTPSIVAYPELQEGVEIIYKGQSIYGEVKVVDIGWQRYLLVDGALQTEINKWTGESTSPYLRYLEMAIFFVPRARDALVIGVGGGPVTRKFEEQGLAVDAVEIDPKIIEVAAEYFDYQGDANIQDGRYFLRKVDKKYDIIVLDVSSGHTLPFHMFTLEVFREFSEKLNEEGLLVVNSGGYVDSRLQGSIGLTLMQVYPEIHTFATNRDSLGNIIFFAFKKSLAEKGGVSSYGLKNLQIVCGERCDQYPYNEFPYIIENKRVGIDIGDAIIFRDDHNPIDVWDAELADEFRNNHISFFGEGVMLR